MKILNEVNHPNLVKCFYIFQEGEFYNFIMEFIGGGDLAELIIKKPGPNLINLFIKDFIAETCLAFDYLHSKGIYHKDFKPENVMITELV